MCVSGDLCLYLCPCPHVRVRVRVRVRPCPFHRTRAHHVPVRVHDHIHVHVHFLFMRIEWAQYCPPWLPTFMREWVNSNGLGARRLRTNFQSMWQLKVTNKKILKIVDGTSGYPKSCSKDPRAYPAASLDRCQRSQLALAVFGRIELT
jgi:hypothetical protein